MRTAVNICLIGVEDADEAGEYNGRRKACSTRLGACCWRACSSMPDTPSCFVFSRPGSAGLAEERACQFPNWRRRSRLVVELVGGILLLIGLQTRSVALALCIWCLITAFAYHLPDTAMMHDMNHFYKHLGLAGGFISMCSLTALELSASTGPWAWKSSPAATPHFLRLSIDGRRQLAPLTLSPWLGNP